MFSDILKAFGLGSLIEDPIAIEGASLHKTWKIKTEYGAFALKALNLNALNYLKKTLLPTAVSQTIARGMQALGIPAVAALKTKHNTDLFDERYLVTPWVEGRHYDWKALNEKHFYAIGVLLRNLHQAGESFNLPQQPPPFIGLSRDDWRQLLQQTNKEGHELEQLTLWSEWALHAAPTLNEKLIITHRDLDHKNIIWQENGNFALIDWEYAGWMNPDVDLFAVAMNCAGVMSGDLDLHAIKHLLKGYGKDLKLSPEILAGYLGYCMDWLIFNLKNEENFNINHQIIKNESSKTFQAMKLVVNKFNTLENL